MEKINELRVLSRAFKTLIEEFKEEKMKVKANMGEVSVPSE